jgi:hypothetical protein
LRAQLTKLSAELLADYDTRNLGTAMSNAAVTAAVGDPNDHRLARARRANPNPNPNNNDDGDGRVAQTDVVPWVQEVVDFDRPEQFPDDTYTHTLLMAAVVLDPVHQAKVSSVVAVHNLAWPGGGTAKLSAAAIKAFARAKTKIVSDYRNGARPLAQHNVDVVRCLVSADTPEELLALAKALSEAFG